MRTRPEDISLTREEVDMASSRRRTGSARGWSWTAKEMWPRRLPNSVPVIFRPREGEMEVAERVEGMESQLHAGMMVWKVKMLRNERMSEDSFFVVVGFVCCCGEEKEEIEGDDPFFKRSLSKKSLDSEALRFEGMILNLLFLVVALLLLWRVRFCSCCCCCFMLIC